MGYISGIIIHCSFRCHGHCGGDIHQRLLGGSFLVRKVMFLGDLVTVRVALGV